MNAQAPPPPLNFDVAVDKARLLDAKIKALVDKHAEELAPYRAAMVKVKALLLDGLNKSGQQNASTPSGGCHKKERRSVSLEDPAEFQRHVIGTEEWDLLDWKANLTAVTDYLDKHQSLPPGVKMSVMLDVGLTAPNKKGPKAASPKTPKAFTAGVVAVAEALDDSWDAAEAMADEILEEQEALGQE